MGIKEINKTIREKVPEAFASIPLNTLSGHAVAIDTSLWAFKRKSKAMKVVLANTPNPLEPLDSNKIIQNIVFSVRGFITKLTKRNITPVWIFDGPTLEDKLAVKRRKDVKKVKKNTIAEERERILSLDPLERKSEIPNFQKLLLQDIFVTKDEMQAIREELESFGIKVIDAPYDAEIYASVLSRLNKVIAVWSVDTDTYAVGARITINDFDTTPRGESEYVEVTLISVILHSLKITQEQFRDLCIMHTCDFNIGVPKIGRKTSIKLMENNNWNLDEVVANNTDKDWDLLNVERCREILSGPEIEDFDVSEFKIDYDKWNNKLKELETELDISNIGYLYHYPSPPKEIEVET